MNSLTETNKPWMTKLSSAGLVYLHFGRRVINLIAGILHIDHSLPQVHVIECYYEDADSEQLSYLCTHIVLSDDLPFPCSLYYST